MKLTDFPERTWFRDLLNVRRSKTFKMLQAHNTSKKKLSPQAVTLLAKHLLDAEAIASAEERAKVKDGKYSQSLRRKAAKLSNLDDDALLAAWLDPLPLEGPERFPLEIRREVADHIWRAGGEVSADDLNAIKQALKKIGAHKPVPPPSRKTIANLEHAGATPEPARRADGREGQVVFDDLVLMLACVFWELTGSKPGWSRRKVPPRKGFRAFIIKWANAEGEERAGFRQRVASDKRMEKAAKLCARRDEAKKDGYVSPRPIELMRRRKSHV